jgi:GntR family transcriptional regulator
MKRIPVYRRLYSELKQRIRDGVYEPGTLLPSEPALEKDFSVSRTTIRKAMEILANEGLVRVQQGKGTEILNPSTSQQLKQISSVTETLTQKGYLVTTRAMHIESVIPPEPVRSELQIANNSKVFKLQRVQLADGQPLAIVTNYLNENFVPGFGRFLNSFTGLYGLLEREYGIVLDHAVERLYAEAASFTEANILDIPVSSPLLCSIRTSYFKNNPIEYGITKFIADRYEYSIHLYGRPSTDQSFVAGQAQSP